MATVILRPNGVGNSTQWAANGAGTNWGCVTSNDGDTTYISSATSGHIDLYTIDASALPSDAIISGITVSHRIRREVGGINLTHSVRIRIGGTTYSGTNGTLTGASVSYILTTPGTWATNPNSGVAWTVANINALEIGSYRGAGAVTARVTEVYVTVTYTQPPPAAPNNSAFFFFF